jgi:glycosyltransferase involved in cell wall biosynthesis
MNTGDTASGQTRWLVLDVRLARDGVNSGISRFIVGLAQALARVIAERKADDATLRDAKLLLVSRYEPAPWIVDLVQRYPTAVSFWSGGKGALALTNDKPVYRWATSAFETVKRVTGENFIWISPGNFDRPMCVWPFGSACQKKIVQIVHDTIAFEHRKSVGFLFGMQFRFRVRQALTRLPVLTVSRHSAELLKGLVKGKEVEIPVLGEGIDEIFGAMQRPTDGDEVAFQRREWLARAGVLTPNDETALMRELAGRLWVIGVGRGQSYKNWDVAEKALAICREKRREAVMFLRVAPDAASFQAYAARPNAQQLGSAVYVPSDSLLVVSALTDELLAQLYRIADVLVHPSSAEGFGLPPLEAALSGLPVVFRQGTAVDEHLPAGAVPEFFWRPVVGDNPEEWALAIAKTLFAKGVEVENFRAAMLAAPSPRHFIASRTGGRRFDWTESAERFLNAIAAPSNSSSTN